MLISQFSLQLYLQDKLIGSAYQVTTYTGHLKININDSYKTFFGSEYKFFFVQLSKPGFSPIENRLRLCFNPKTSNHSFYRMKLYHRVPAIGGNQLLDGSISHWPYTQV